MTCRDRLTVLVRATAWLVAGCMVAAAGAARAGTFETHTLELGDAAVVVYIENGDMGVGQNEIIRWVRRAADALVAYYGRFPVDRVEIAVGKTSQGRIEGGTAYGGEQIVINVGPETRPSDLDEDWRMTHEMVHLSFPDLDRRHVWMTEGVATYVESVARARAGQIPPEKMWWWMVTGLPKGLPREGDRGLDRTHSWGRTYWGGALYFFLADLNIRLETDNRRSLNDALRGILDAGGNGNVHWDVARVTAVGDEATGTTVMTDLYEALAEKPVTPDLADWFHRLGVIYENDEITFDDQAPLAHIRRAVTAAAPARPPRVVTGWR